jgi:cytochrome b pre-mRNA-processing protein 3
MAKQPPAASWWTRLRHHLYARRSRREAAHDLYMALVEQARRPVFYAEWGVPDSRDGRLEMVTLHAMLVMRRLRDEGTAGAALSQVLFDVIFADLDRHLREWGVGDLSVGKEVKKLAQSFLGRLTALDPLLSSGNLDAMDKVLGRNVFTEVAMPEPALVRRLATYLVMQDRWLAGQDGSALLSGHVAFAPVSGPTWNAAA